MNTIKIYLAESGRIADLHKDFPLYQGQFQDKLLNVYVPTSILAPQFDVQHYIGQMTGAEAPSSDELNAFVVANTYPSRQKAQGDIIEFYNTTSLTFYIYTYNGTAWENTEVDSFGTLTNIAGTSIKIGMIGVQRNGKLYESKSYFMRYLKTLTYQNVEYALYERKLPKEFTSIQGQGQNAPTIVANVVNIDTSNNKVLSIITSQTCQLDVMTSTMLDQDETVDASELESLQAQVNDNSAKILLKQNIIDNGLLTTQKTIVGAINEVKGVADTNASNISTNTEDITNIKAEQITQNADISANTHNIESNANNISNLQTRVTTLEQEVTIEEHYVGQMTGFSLPTDSQLNQYVNTVTGSAPKGGEVIIYVLQISGETDKIYKYTYSSFKEDWDYFVIPSTEPASNTDKGIIQGSYNGSSVPSTQINITNGEIEDVYVVDGSSTKRRLAEYLNTDHSTLVSTTAKSLQNEQDISTNAGKISNVETSITNIINGTTEVGRATRATADNLGNAITSTYLTTNAGVTKTQMREYALPRVFNDVNYLTSTGYSDTLPDSNDPIFTRTVSAVGDFEIFSIEKTISNASFELSNKNSYIDNIYVSASGATVQFRLTTEIFVNNTWVTANVELSDIVEFSGTDTLKKLTFASPFILLDDVYSLTDGNKIKQTLEVTTFTSFEKTFSIYSNEVYPSTFYLNTTSQTIFVAQGKLGELKHYDIEGTGNSSKISFRLPADAYIYNNTQALFSLSYIGTITDSTQMEFTYNSQSIQIITPANDGTNNPATVGSMATKRSSNVSMWEFTGIFFVNTYGTIRVLADVDKISLDSYYTKTETNDLLSNKQNTLSETQLSAVNSGIDSTKVTQIGTNTSDIGGLASRMTTAEGDIDAIEGKIPSEATSSNQLADKAYVNNSINSVTAYYITSNAAGDPFGTKSQLTNATTFFSGGVERTPTRNDYCIVLADESKGTVVSGYSSFTTTAQYVGYFVIYNNTGVEVTSANKDSVGITAGTTIAYENLPSTRYSYQNSQWEFQYQINESPLTTSQLATLNSGLTAADKTKLDGISSGAQVNDVTDVQINGTSILSNKVANFVTNTAYNASTNKLATMSDVPSTAGFETTLNKVTSLSSASTNDQYPSAKCVYDLVGDIDTILTDLYSGQGV